MIFPEKYNLKEGRLNYLKQWERKILAECNYVITEDEKYIKELETIMDYFLTMMKPRNINGGDPNNIIVTTKRAYEKVCGLLTLSGINAPGQLSIIKFHVAVDMYESKRGPKS